MPEPILAQALAANRARYNAKFAEARHYKPRLDPQIFSDLLRDLVAPIVEAVASTNPEAVEPVTEALYDLSLDLLAQDLLGPNSRYPMLAAGWANGLPRLARHLAVQPRPVIGALTNALYNLSLTPGARPAAWLTTWLSLADECPDVPTLLTTGQICAWQAGMAHYRAQALALCQSLSPRLARLALGLPVDSDQPFDSVLNRLQTDPWYHPIPEAQPSPPEIKIAARVGAFRGFGGLFLVPPIVEPAGDGFLVTDGEGTWLLMVDAFGATFQRMARPDSQPPIDTPFSITRAGKVSAKKQSNTFAELELSTSTAGNAHTLAVSVPYSHAIYLVAIL